LPAGGAPRTAAILQAHKEVGGMRNQGVTLPEVVVVIAIMALLAGLGAPAMNR